MNRCCKFYLCQQCPYEMVSGRAGSTACLCIQQPFTQTGTHRAAAGSPRRAQCSSRYVWWYVNTPLNTGTFRKPSLPDDALKFRNWDLFPNLLSVQEGKKKKKSWSWELSQRHNLGMPTGAVRSSGKIRNCETTGLKPIYPSPETIQEFNTICFNGSDWSYLLIKTIYVEQHGAFLKHFSGLLHLVQSQENPLFNSSGGWNY